jgi:hypothetical protein
MLALISYMVLHAGSVEDPVDFTITGSHHIVFGTTHRTPLSKCCCNPKETVASRDRYGDY